MISAATAATAVLMVTLVRDHGLQYLLAATFVAGVLQILCGICLIAAAWWLKGPGAAVAAH